jgi:hypothetical protein
MTANGGWFELPLGANCPLPLVARLKDKNGDVES